MAPHVGGAAAEHGGVVLAVGAHEDTGGAGAQALRVDAGPLQGLPGGFEEQPLLRVHGQGLARRDAEEGGVEESGAVEEAALQGGGAAPGEGLQVPAAVGGEAGDGVAAVGQQAPQVVGGLDAAGEPAAHADDDHRVVVRGPSRSRVGVVPGSRFGQGAQEFGEEVGGQVAGGRVVVDEGGGQPQAGGGGQGVAQFDGGQRVEAEVGEGPVGFDGGRVGVAEHGGDLGAQEVEQVPLAGRAGQGGDLAAQDRLRVRGGAVRAAAGAEFGQVADEGPVRGEHGRVPLPVDVGDEEGGVAVADGGVEGGEGVLGAHRGEAAAADPVLDAGAVAGHAGAGPGTPGHGGGGQAQVAPVLGQGVQVGVGRGVVGLAGGAEDARGRREEHEVGEPEVAGQLVQVGGGAGLGVEDGGEPLGGEGVEQTVVEDARGVHDGGERVLLRYGGQGRGERGAVGRVAGDDRHPGALLAQLRDEFGGTGGVRAASAREQQVRGAASGEQPGDVGAEGAGAAGDQDGALGGERAGRRSLGSGVAGEAPRVGGGGADGELVLRTGCGEQVREASYDPLVDVLGQVDQGEPALGALQDGDAAEAPEGGLPGVGEAVSTAGADRLPGEQPDGGGDPGVVQGGEGGGGGRERGGAGRVVGGARFGGAGEGEGGQGEDAGEPAVGVGQSAQGGGERGAVGGGRGVDRDDGGVRAECLQECARLGCGGAGRAQDQPGAVS